MKDRERLTYTSFFILGGVLLLFIILPLVRLIFFHSPQLILKELQDKTVIIPIINSISLSLITAFIAAVFGVPLAFLMAKKRFGKLEETIETIVDLPLAVPHTVAGIALLFVFGRRGVIGALFYKGFGFRITGTRIAIVLAMLFVSLPYLVDSAKDGFKKVDISLEKASRSLGASLFSTFRYIYLPLSKNEILSGFLLTWARAISEFGAVVIVAYYPMTAPVKIYDAFTQYNLSVSGTIAGILLVICLSVFLVIRLLLRRKQ